MTLCLGFRALNYSCCFGVIIMKHLYSQKYTYLDGYLNSQILTITMNFLYNIQILLSSIKYLKR